MSARDEILARIDRALSGPQTTAPSVTRDYRVAGDCELSHEQLIDLLIDRLVDYRAGVHRTDASGAGAVIAAVLAQSSAVRILVPDGVPPDLIADLQAVDGLTIVTDGPALTARDLDALDAVVTTSTVAIAETGTIVLDGGSGQGRRAASLVPDIHLLIVRADQVVYGVPEALERLDPTSPMTWISGPSATSDIELNRVEGVHGPRRLDVIIIT